MSNTAIVNEEIKGDEIWNYISKNKSVRAAVIHGIVSFQGGIPSGVYKLEDENISFTQRLIKYAESGENVRFYVLDKVDVDTSEEG